MAGPILPQGYHWDPAILQGAETSALTAKIWPNYMVLDSDIPEPGVKVEIAKQEFERRFPVWGIRSDATGELAAFASGVLLSADLSAPQLPDSGWRWAIQRAFAREQPNCLCLLVANVDPKARGLGLSRTLIERAKTATRELAFSTMIAPVRPTLKHEFPELSMSDYLMRDATDPWLKLHLQAGGRISNICSESVRILATLARWREWTKLALHESGDYLLPLGLAPLQVDASKNVGVYVEPNVWVRYEFS